MKKNPAERLKAELDTLKKVKAMIQKDWIGKEFCGDMNLSCAKCFAEQTYIFLGGYEEYIKEELLDLKKEKNAKKTTKGNNA